MFLRSMAYRLMWLQIGDPRSCHTFGEHSVSLSLSSGLQPKSSEQTEQANHQLATVLRYLTSQDPGSWSLQLPWMEYSISLPTTRLPLPVLFGVPAPIFPIQAGGRRGTISIKVQRCRRAWRCTRPAACFPQNHVSQAPKYLQGQCILLSTQDLPLPETGPILHQPVFHHQ